MTIATATITTTTDTHAALEAAGAEFDGYRGRIALLSVEAIGTLTDMFSFLGPVDETTVIDAELVFDAEVIDIEVIESTVGFEAPVLQLAG